MDEWRLTNLGISMPSSEQTHGYLPSNVEVFAEGIGFVGGVEIGGGDDYVDGVWRCLTITDPLDSVAHMGYYFSLTMEEEHEQNCHSQS